MQIIVGRWQDAFESLTAPEQHEAYKRAYEAVASYCDQVVEAGIGNEAGCITADPKKIFLKRYEVYVRKARRYQMRQRRVHTWTTFDDVGRVLVWKAVNEVRDHLRKIRRKLAQPMPVVPLAAVRQAKAQKQWIETIIQYFEAKSQKVASDAAILLEYLWSNPSRLEKTEKRIISFKAKRIATDLTEITRELWTPDRVQKARRHILKEIASYKGETITDIIREMRSTIA